MNDNILEEKNEEEEMEVIRASATEIIAIPQGVEDFVKKAKGKKMTKEEERKWIEKNVMGEFYD